MTAPPIRGVHHLKVPVRDLQRSRDWYERVLGLSVGREFTDDDGVVRGVAGGLVDPAGQTVLSLALRVDPAHSSGTGGFDPLSLAIGSFDDLAAWQHHLSAEGVDTSTIADGDNVRAIAVRDPDQVEIRLFAARSE